MRTPFICARETRSTSNPIPRLTWAVVAYTDFIDYMNPTKMYVHELPLPRRDGLHRRYGRTPTFQRTHRNLPNNCCNSSGPTVWFYSSCKAAFLWWLDLARETKTPSASNTEFLSLTDRQMTYSHSSIPTLSKVENTSCKLGRLKWSILHDNIE